MNKLADSILTIIRWSITLPTFIIEGIVKFVILIILFILTIPLLIFYPITKDWESPNWLINVANYGREWEGGFELTSKVFDLWQ